MKLFLAFFLAATLAIAATAADRKPNIIVIYTDDHGWPDVGPAGIYDDLKTPHLDQLAKTGVHATNGYSSAPQCVPSRAGLLSGRAQNRFGVESNAEPLDGFNAQATIADRLKKAGYATGQIGKWHLGQTNAITDHGFDDVYAKNANRPCSANFNLKGETIKMQQVDDKLYHLDACSEAAIQFIRRHEAEPFFLYLAYRAPHVPLDAPPKYLSRFPGKMPERRRQALAMISAMDDGVGRIVAELKEKGLSENTLIFYIGDNGAPLKIHKLDAPGGGPGWDGSLNEPMNGEKGMLAEGGIRVPFLVSWPGTIPGGQVYDHPITALDVAATAVELAGLPLDDKLDGVNLLPFLSGEKSGAPHEFLTWRWIAQSAVRSGKWKLLRGGDREYLFDLESDPGESKNRLSEHPEVANLLRQHLEGWASELKPPGLGTGEMSTVWEQYFDHYLDGKTAEPKKISQRTETKIESWIARGGSLKAGESFLQVTPDKKSKGCFIVTTDVRLQEAFTATIVIRTEKGGRIGVAWRTKDAKDFSNEMTVTSLIEASQEFQKVSIEVPAKGNVIHTRVLLPEGVTSIQSIEFSNSATRKVWKF